MDCLITPHFVALLTVQNDPQSNAQNSYLWPAQQKSTTQAAAVTQSPEVSCVDCVWNVMAHVQKPVFIFRRNGWVHLNRQGRQFSRLPAAEVCASVVVMLDTPCSEVVGRVLATHSIRQFPLHFPSCASPCAITFQLDSTPTPVTTFVTK